MGGKHWAELRFSGGHYHYAGNGCGGSLGPVKTKKEAIAIMQARVDIGYFLPDKAVLPMKRVL